MDILEKFSLKGKVVIITGGAGLLGEKHAETVAEFKAIPVILDLAKHKTEAVAARITKQYDVRAIGMAIDITSELQVSQCCLNILQELGKIDVLINNAANNPAVEANEDGQNFSRLENFDLDLWNQDLAVGLTGAFLCSKHFGYAIAQNPDGGTIVNISSDLGLIAPDQRLYQQEGVPEKQQNVKPVTYSVVKHGIIGLTKYLATYWADKNVRVNSITPGGVYVNQPEDFVKKLSNLIPMGRMATHDEYKAAILFLVSDASSYMTGANLAIDGGRTCW